ncbi:MAG TPA: FMN-binding protein [Fervidobacterium sp.]|nr:FMN-binding protein [Fervidobacterium sp.]HUM43629.1 FMN-binding protein [Fervidobacterium sp.]
MKKSTKILITVVMLISVVVGAFLISYMRSVQHYQNAVANISYENENASKIPDGTYIGECDVQFIYAKVEVTVKNGVIENIKLLEHRNKKGASAERIVNKIMEQQCIDVDAVSGATNSSKVIKKAVDNALSNARTGKNQ